MTEPFLLYIQTNSPGELTSWVGPFAKAAAAHNPAVRIIILLTPCQYATGNEHQVAASFPGVVRVYPPKETIRLLASLPWFRRPAEQGAVLYLGGDPMYAQLFGLKFRFPVYGYTEHARNPGLLFKKAYYKNRDGDLMAARFVSFHPQPEAVTAQGLIPQDYCLFFCGSRVQHFRNLFPFMVRTVQRIRKRHPDFSAAFMVSPFISENELDFFAATLDLTGIRLLRQHSLDVLSEAKLLVTIPGTNTAEAMYCKVPMLVVLPLNRPDLLILDGIAGLIGQIPGLGLLLKKMILRFLKKKHRYYSHPNRMSHEELVPELVDTVTEKEIAERVVSLYYHDDKLREIKTSLSRFAATDDILRRMCGDILGEIPPS